jgi:anti-sigma factor RsiW
MCPDSRLLSIYMDGELPSPWKEKMENHLVQCGGCREKLEKFKRFFDKTDALAEQEIMKAKDRVWQNLASRWDSQRDSQRDASWPLYLRRQSSVWQRRLSIPLPAAAAAGVILAVLAALWISGWSVRQSSDPAAKAHMILASEEALPGIIPSADMNGVFQYLGSDSADVLILRLPESRSFSSYGEPAIIKAADYTRRRP